MPLGRLIAPTFAGSERNRQVVDRRGRRDRALCATVLSQQYARGPGLRKIGCALIDAFRLTELQMRWQRDPELKAANTPGLAGPGGVPDTLARAHPFHAAGPKDAGG